MSRLPDLFTDPDVQRHATARKLVGPAFNQRSIAQWEGTMHSHIEALLKAIQDHGSESMEMGQSFHCFVADLMFDILLAKKTDCLSTSTLAIDIL